MTFTTANSICSAMFQTMQVRAAWHYIKSRPYPAIDAWEELKRDAKNLNYNIERKDFPNAIVLDRRVCALFARLLREVANALERDLD